ncbi:hypothetical protein [Sporosarcina sp. HYO08]|uniref:hypothetical protein n=1 Tax=Sporosarcina sp. HYO08 TaxID=1759557 RepID=UPI00079A3113|nr:hypothetical protein [Sporosarcina sp. HYO08]KXH87145.1 hypothetical protein AU377_00790 [Sporosarcina sp. HYO08]
MSNNYEITLKAFKDLSSFVMAAQHLAFYDPDHPVEDELREATQEMLRIVREEDLNSMTRHLNKLGRETGFIASNKVPQ